MYRNTGQRRIDSFREYVQNQENKGRKNDIVVEVVQPVSKYRRQNYGGVKASANRCCHVSPESVDFGQTVQFGGSEEKRYKLIEDHSFNTYDTTSTHKELKSILYYNDNKVDTSSQYENPEDMSVCLGTDIDEQWLNGDNIENVSGIIQNPVDTEPAPIGIYIEKTPRVKVIVEKFSKLKKENIEVRRLDEKIVCIEYDIFCDGDDKEPIQRLRVFFSMKPSGCGGDEAENVEFLSSIKGRFKIDDHDLTRLNTKEIEIIDAAIERNKSYLDDLNNIMKRKTAIGVKKQCSSLDVDYLYNVAKKDRTAVEDDFPENIPLSPNELDEVKNLILRKSYSSVHGFNRKVIDAMDDKVQFDNKMKGDIAVISKCIIQELVRQLDGIETTAN